MFVGDSLSSNQWQSLTCMVQNAVPSSNYTLVQRKSFYSLTFPVCLLFLVKSSHGFFNSGERAGGVRFKPCDPLDQGKVLFPQGSSHNLSSMFFQSKGLGFGQLMHFLLNQS